MWAHVKAKRHPLAALVLLRHRTVLTDLLANQASGLLSFASIRINNKIACLKGAGRCAWSLARKVPNMVKLPDF